MAALFDMDGLLLDTEPLWGHSMLEIAGHYQVPISPNEFKYTTGLRINEVTAFWKEKFPWTHPVSSEQMAQEIVDDIIERAIKQSKLMEGVLITLQWMEEHMITMGVATSSPTRMMTTLIDHFGIKNYFNCLTSAEETGYGKPHPSVYLHCAQKLNTLPYQCIAFEDSINGLIAAKAARMKLVMIPEFISLNDQRLGLADLKLNSLSEFKLHDYNNLMML